jgi:hypothetical protein
MRVELSRRYRNANWAAPSSHYEPMICSSGLSEDFRDCTKPYLPNKVRPGFQGLQKNYQLIYGYLLRENFNIFESNTFIWNDAHICWFWLTFKSKRSKIKLFFKGCF